MVWFDADAGAYSMEHDEVLSPLDARSHEPIGVTPSVNDTLPSGDDLLGLSVSLTVAFSVLFWSMATVLGVAVTDVLVVLVWTVRLVEPELSLCFESLAV